jgi:dihydroorotate dehydrogenase
MNAYAKWLRPLLFRADPESMHDRAIAAAERWSASPWLCAQTKRLFQFHDERLTVQLAGMRFPHPIGLAAGFDKSGRGIPFWEALGFGHVEIGSVSADLSSGNPRPRLFRAPEDRAIVVNYGLPNDGAIRVAERLAKLNPAVPLGLNIVNTNHGPGAPPQANEAIIADYVASIRLLEPHATYLSLNLSCPNTCDGRAFVSDTRRVRDLLDAVASVTPQRPVFLKVAPFAETSALDSFLTAVDQYSFIRGFSINLPPGKPEGMITAADRLRSMPGAVSGRPAAAAANRAIAELYRRIDRRKHCIMGSGGVFNAEDAWYKIQLGASMVQCLTALIYEGPGVVRRICKGLAEIAAREGLQSIQQGVGSAVSRSALRSDAGRAT